MKTTISKLNHAASNVFARVQAGICCAKLRSNTGQGTTEYAILVGVLVVIAVIAITAFRGKLSSLWDSIASSINGL